MEKVEISFLKLETHSVSLRMMNFKRQQSNIFSSEVLSISISVRDTQKVL